MNTLAFLKLDLNSSEDKMKCLVGEGSCVESFSRGILYCCLKTSSETDVEIASHKEALRLRGARGLNVHVAHRSMLFKHEEEEFVVAYRLNFQPYSLMTWYKFGV